MLYRYGKHLSKAETDALVAPHPTSVHAVDSWLDSHDIDPKAINRNGDWVTLRITVAQAERLLGAKYNVYHHPASSERVVRTMSYSLPRALHSHVDVVAPTTYFGTLRSMRVTSFLQDDVDVSEEFAAPASFVADPDAVSLACGAKITPECLRALYKTTDYVPTQTATNRLGVAGFLDEFANYADLQVSPSSLCSSLHLN